MTHSQDQQAAPSLNLVFVDHSGQPGGGQLGLQRYLGQPSSHKRKVVFVAGGPVTGQLQDKGVETTVVFPNEPYSRRLLLRSIPRLRAILKSHDSNTIVIANSGYAALALALSGVPSRGMVNYLRTEAAPPDSTRLKRWFDTNVVLRRFAGYLANSEWTRGTLPPILASRPARVAYPLSGVDTSDSQGRVAPLSGQHAIRIASFSRLDRWKGIDTLIDAVELVAKANPGTDLRLDIYGGQFFADAAFADELEAKAAQGRVPTTFHGHIDDVPTRLRTTDIVVVPSRHPEPFGQVVAQAITHGCVTIISNHGGAIEQVTDGVNGLTFEPGDAASLAATLERCIHDPEEAARLAAHAGTFGESMNDRVLASAFDTAITQLSEEMLRA
ncbi:glycosyltransferase family 4 protein [Microbacterium yannicii]|uniref:Glycosyltransferase family 4 protein n=1 Tax=Microbacterium yannicii TaxID=671622 RepID=A0ABP9ME66_9MICO|nr:glycosyltransferase family 4 protein [Microbacterium yannicii]MCO5952801.1 glycosyltransferase family 4 protein [Microbacterium yannicii]